MIWRVLHLWNRATRFIRGSGDISWLSSTIINDANFRKQQWELPMREEPHTFRIHIGHLSADITWMSSLSSWKENKMKIQLSLQHFTDFQNIIVQIKCVLDSNRMYQHRLNVWSGISLVQISSLIITAKTHLKPRLVCYTVTEWTHSVPQLRFMLSQILTRQDLHGIVDGDLLVTKNVIISHCIYCQIFVFPHWKLPL